MLYTKLVYEPTYMYVVTCTLVRHLHMISLDDHYSQLLVWQTVIHVYTYGTCSYCTQLRIYKQICTVLQ